MVSFSQLYIYFRLSYYRKSIKTVVPLGTIRGSPRMIMYICHKLTKHTVEGSKWVKSYR